MGKKKKMLLKTGGGITGGGEGDCAAVAGKKERKKRKENPIKMLPIGARMRLVAAEKKKQKNQKVKGCDVMMYVMYVRWKTLCVCR